jgi:hypothetical protein
MNWRMGLSLLIPIMLADSMDLGVIVEAQRGGWFVILQPIAAVIFWITAMAELQRHPFDLLEAEQELSAGFNVEYGGMRFGMFFMAEYMKMVILSAIAGGCIFLWRVSRAFCRPIPGFGLCLHGYKNSAWPVPDDLDSRLLAPFPLRSINELRLESFATCFRPELHYYRFLYLAG